MGRVGWGVGWWDGVRGGTPEGLARVGCWLGLLKHQRDWRCWSGSRSNGRSHGLCRDRRLINCDQERTSKD